MEVVGVVIVDRAIILLGRADGANADTESAARAKARMRIILLAGGTWTNRRITTIELPGAGRDVDTRKKSYVVDMLNFDGHHLNFVGCKNPNPDAKLHSKIEVQQSGYLRCHVVIWICVRWCSMEQRPNTVPSATVVLFE